MYDDRLLAEYRQVLSRPRFPFAPTEISALLDFIAAEGELVIAPPIAATLPGQSWPDESDLPFLEVALAGRAEMLVTGNARHFLPRHGELTVQLVDPATFIRLWSRQG
ncbi:hypothetical protein BH24DEI1_BH24DEI1_17740 [soil metagenome]|nr:PIN domain-containing protein [Deinococcota bacterium]